MSSKRGQRQMALPETAHLLDLNLSCPLNSEKGVTDEPI